MSELAGAGTMYSSRLEVARVESAPSLKYKTENTANDPLIKNSIYYGRNMNIAATVPSEVDNYPAFAYCASMNKDVNGDGTIDDNEMVWYLPSQNQLMAMYVFSGGMDVTFRGNYPYWSATETYSTAKNASWDVHFSTGNTSPTIKYSSANVRCVRDIKP